MVTRAQIDRLAQRIESLAKRRTKPYVAIRVLVGDGETEAEAITGAQARHYEEHPEDRGARDILYIIRTIVDPIHSDEPCSTGARTDGLKGTDRPTFPPN
jgi:hypothetical protein